MAITTFDEAEAEFEAACADAKADYPEEGYEPEWHDMVVSVCWNIDDVQVARELCRTKLGYVPRELEGRLGRTDWLGEVL